MNDKPQPVPYPTAIQFAKTRIAQIDRQIACLHAERRLLKERINNLKEAKND